MADQDQSKLDQTAISEKKTAEEMTENTQDVTIVSKSGDIETAGTPSTGIEKGFYSNFMNPMFAKMEESVKKNNDMLDEIQRKMDEERELRRKERLSRHIPGPLQGKGRDMEDIMKHIQDLVVFENYQEDEDPTKRLPAKLKGLDDHANVAVLGHSMAAYVSTLELTHLRTFITRIISDTTLWLSRLFRFDDASAYFHEDEREGLVRIARLALHQKYPKLNTDGFEAMYSRPPVLYISAAAKPGLGHYICSQLGLPMSCLSTVPVNLNAESPYAMDISMLEKLVEEDNASAKTPVLVVAYAGTPLTGHVDNIDKINEICRENKMWVHIEGSNLATLAMYSVPTSVSSAKSGDSMTLNLGAWLGLPAIPFITLYKSADPAIAHTVGLTTIHARYKLHSLPIWLCLQSLGHEGVVERVKFSMDLSKKLSTMVGKIPYVKIVSKKNKVKDNKIEKVSFTELIQKAISALILFEIENPTLVFKYQPGYEEKVGSDDGAESESDDLTDQEPHDPYHDALNLWLSETMKREIPKVQTSTVEVEGEGVCIRFSPLETSHNCDTTAEDIDAFALCLQKQLKILEATVRQREPFAEIVEAQDNMTLVTLYNWAGLGAVQYIPERWVDKLDNLPDEGLREINSLNTQLVQQLKSSDTAFSLGTSAEALACVRFGLITDDTDLEELIALVYTTGKEVEESSKFLETMADVVRQGIEKANEDLQKESEQKLIQEGVLRQVPLVGSFLNWFSPAQSDEIGVKGRTFSLASGKIDSTEKTYKYHMQVQEANADKTPSRVQGPLKNALKPAKRRLRGLSGGSSTDPGAESATESMKELQADSVPNSPEAETTPKLELAVTSSTAEEEEKITRAEDTEHPQQQQTPEKNEEKTE